MTSAEASRLIASSNAAMDEVNDILIASKTHGARHLERAMLEAREVSRRYWIDCYARIDRVSWDAAIPCGPGRMIGPESRNISYGGFAELEA